MARLYLYGVNLPLLLSTEDSVGKGGANKKLDVMLVQFFLRATARVNDKSWGWLIDRKVPLPNIDGIYGSVTQDWIDRFQQSINKLKAEGKIHLGLVADGRVDAIVNGLSETANHRAMTMYYLNNAYFALFGRDAFSRIHKDPLMPRE